MDHVALYQKHAKQWRRTQANCLSDFTARAPVLADIDNINEKSILDLGCGEGYCARQLTTAKQLHGIDISPAMVKAAKVQSLSQQHSFQVARAENLPFKANSFDLVLAMFVFNYLDIKQMQQAFHEVQRVLKPNGEFLFTVPHPLALLQKQKTQRFDFENINGYFSSRDKFIKGHIACRNGERLPVACHHKTFSDYFSALNQAGFNHFIKLEEFSVDDELINLDHDFFAPLQDEPLHVYFRLRK